MDPFQVEYDGIMPEVNTLGGYDETNEGMHTDRPLMLATTTPVDLKALIQEET